MECLAEGRLTPAELGVAAPLLLHGGFDVVADSNHNADLRVQLLDSMIRRRGILDLREAPGNSRGDWPAKRP